MPSGKMDKSQLVTVFRYRCQVAWPRTGMTTARPTNRGIDPSTKPPTMISPHTAMVRGFAIVTRTDVQTAIATPTFRSSNRGNDTTLIASTSTAKRKPTPNHDWPT